MSQSNLMVVAGGTLVAGILVGGLVGYLAHGMFSPSEPASVILPPPEIIEQQITDEDLARLCEELTDDEKTRVVAAQEKVVELQSTLEAKEAALAEYKAKEITDERRRRAAAKKWKEMEAEIERLKGELQVAEQQRDELRVELKQTLKDLDRQIAQTAKYKQKAIEYKEKSTKNAWSAFTAQAKVEICDRGTRRRHAKCHEAVDEAMSPFRGRWTECVDTYQAVPELRQLDRKESMPQFAEELPDDNKFTKKGWVVVFCDPSLPEAGETDDI